MTVTVVLCLWFTLQVINALKAENNIINTKLRRVEGENVLKVQCKEFVITNKLSL